MLTGELAPCNPDGLGNVRDRQPTLLAEDEYETLGRLAHSHWKILCKSGLSAHRAMLPQELALLTN